MSQSIKNSVELADQLVNQGRIRDAIEVLREILESNPDDRRVLNRLGDLYVAAKEPGRAIELYRRVAQGFERDGMATKAISLLRKVVRIDDSQWDVYERLGDLYRDQQLPFEAAAQYQTVAEGLHQSKDYRSAIRVQREVVALRPKDAAAHARLADFCSQIEDSEGSRQAYSEIGKLMLEAGQPEQALRVYSKVLEADFDAQFAERSVEQLKKSDQNGLAARLAMRAQQLSGEAVPEDNDESRAQVVPSRSTTARKEVDLASDGLETVELEAVGPEAVDLEVAQPEQAPQSSVDVSLDDALAVAGTAEGDPAEGANPAEEGMIFDIDLAELGQDTRGDVSSVEAEPTVFELTDGPAPEPDIETQSGELDAELQALMDDAEREIVAGNLDRALSRLTTIRGSAGNNPRFRGLWHRVNHPDDPVIPTEPPVQPLVEQPRVEMPSVETHPIEAPLLSADLASPGSQAQDLRVIGAEVDRGIADAGSGIETEPESIEDIVTGFTKGLAEALSPEDYDTHYNLGIAYQEMGLVDESIGEFQISAKSPEHLVESAAMLGLAFRQRGLHDLAFEWYQRARSCEVATDEQQLAMRYEQAETQLEAEEVEQAYQLYREIYGIDSTYRDVAQRIDDLRTA